jgi:hypothetical protein
MGRRSPAVKGSRARRSCGPQGGREDFPKLIFGPGNLGGNAQRTRHIFNKAFLEALAKDFQEGGPQAIAKVRKQQPAAYMKICALLVPKEFKVERTGGVKDLTDEELDQAIAAVKAMLAARTGETAKVIEDSSARIAAGSLLLFLASRSSARSPLLFFLILI